jgi:serine/threonine-protein kinase RsbW
MPERLLAETAEELYEEAPCGYLMTSPDGTIRRVNRTFVAWTGHDRGELLEGRRFQDLLSPGGRIYHETHVAPLLRMQDAVSEIALEVVCANGERLPVLVNYALKRDTGGEPVLVRITVFSAAERRTYERELLRARRAEQEARERIERLHRITAALAAVLDASGIAETLLAELAGMLELDAAAVDLDGGRRLAALGDVAAPGAVRIALPGGALTVRLRDGVAPGADDAALLDAAAAQCGLALERERLREETAAAARRAEFLADLGRALDQAAGVHDRLEGLLEQLVPRIAAGAGVRVAGVEDLAPGALPAGIDPLLARVAAGGGREAISDGVVLPLSSRAGTLGALAIAGPVPGAGPDFLDDVAERVSVALENARLYEHERTVAHELQRSLLGGAPPQDDRCAIVAHYQAGVRGLEVGGDWHDAFWVRDGVVGVVMGDVVGRGLQAASAMGQLRSALRALSGTAVGPAAVLEQLDRFVEHEATAEWATVFYGELDLAGGALRYACAGHPPPAVVAPDGLAALLWEGRSAPLGGNFLGDRRPEGEARLGAGDRLVLYTDGVVERRGEPLDAGLDRLLAVLGAHAGASGAQLVEALIAELLADAPLDDACLLCLTFRPPA